MNRVNRYHVMGEDLEVPLRWEENSQTYVEDYRDYMEQPVRTPAGRPILLTFEDACPEARMAEDDPEGIDCGACRYYHQFPGSLLGVCGNEKRRSTGTPPEQGRRNQT